MIASTFVLFFVAVCFAERADVDIRDKLAFEQGLEEALSTGDTFVMSYYEPELRVKEQWFKNRARRTLSTVKARACGQRLGHLVKNTCPTGCTINSEFLAEGITNACCEKMCSQAEIVEGCCPPV